MKSEAASHGGCCGGHAGSHSCGGHSHDTCGGDHDHDHKMAHKSQSKIKKKENGISNAHQIMILDSESIDFIHFFLKIIYIYFLK